MAYAALADVKREMGKLSVGLTTTSIPSESDVTNGTLPDIAGDIDGVLSARGITVPVATPQSFLDRLKALNARGAAALAVGALFPMAQGPQSTTQAKWLQDLYDAGLERLRKGEGIPDSITLDGKGALPRSFAMSHPDSSSGDFEGTPGNEIDPVFTRDRKW